MTIRKFDGLVGSLWDEVKMDDKSTSCFATVMSGISSAVSVDYHQKKLHHTDIYSNVNDIIINEKDHTDIIFQLDS